MRIKLKDLSPNPYKKEINKGKLKEEIVLKLLSNIKELGLMGSLPVFEKEQKYFLIAGHHRCEAMKRAFGKDHEIECTVHDYSDENILRGMVVENLTQRTDELLEVTENLAVIRKFLKKNPACSSTVQAKRRDVKGLKDAGSIRDIYEWLGENGEVMSLGKITEGLRIYDKLDKNLLERTVRADGGSSKKETISISEASYLSRLEKKEQPKMKKILDKTGLSRDFKSDLVSEFNDSTDEMKEKILSEEIEIKDIKIEKLKEDIKKKADAEKGKGSGIKVTHYKKYLRDAGNQVGDTNGKIIETCAYLNGLEESGVLYDLDWSTMYKVLEAMTTGGKNYTKFGEKIMQKL